MQERYAYDPYGARTIDNPTYTTVRASSSWAWVYNFQGLRLDTVTDKYNARNRDYDPAEGRWMTQDPIGFGARDPDLYRFVGNGPVNGLDPAGLQPAPEVSDADVYKKAGNIQAAIGTTLQETKGIMGKSYPVDVMFNGVKGTVEVTAQSGPSLFLFPSRLLPLVRGAI